MPHRLVNNQKMIFVRGTSIERPITFSQNDLNRVMQAFLIEHVSIK